MAKRIIIILVALLAVAGIVVGAFVFLDVATGGADGTAPAANGQPGAEQDDDFGTVDVYGVDDGGNLTPAATGLTLQVWRLFQRVVTPQFAAEVMTQYRVGDAPDSDTLAYVYQDDDPDYWILADNLATSGNVQDLIGTLVHEYSHILTLDGTQMDQNFASCDTLELSEGCAEDASYLWSFEEAFWAGYTDAPAADNDDADAAYAFYLAHEEDFVDDYAATNVVEDIAESFMTFVIEDEPAGDSVVAQKLGFFWQYPELTVIRDRIRAEFTTELGLSVP